MTSPRTRSGSRKGAADVRGPQLNVIPERQQSPQRVPHRLGPLGGVHGEIRTGYVADEQ